MTARRVSLVFLGLLLAALTVGPRVSDLHAGWSSDEARWLARSQSFTDALARGDFAGTGPEPLEQGRSRDPDRPSYHPGVTTMFLGGLGIARQASAGPEAGAAEADPRLRLARARLPVALTTAVAILLAGALCARLFGAPTALVAVFLLAVDPFFLAESRRLHVDALAAAFLLLGVLSWLCYLEGERPRRTWLALAGAAFGLACLSKSAAGAFLVALPALLAWYGWARGLSALRLGWATSLWGASATLTVLTCWPYLWQWRAGPVPVFPLAAAAAAALAALSAHQHERAGPERGSRPRVAVLAAVCLGLLAIAALALVEILPVLERVYWAVVRPHGIPHLFLGRVYGPGLRADPDAMFTLLYYPVHGFYWSGPLTLPLVLFAGWRLTRTRDARPRSFRAVVALCIVGGILLLCFVPVAKKLARYLVLGAPLWDVVAALGLVELARLVAAGRLGRLAAAAGLGVVLAVQLAFVLRLHPFYRAYHHPALPKTWVVRNITLGAGVGLDLAADYLMARPDAEQLAVAASPFAKILFHVYRSQQPVEVEQLDYYVYYVRDKQIGTGGHPRFMEQLEHVVTVNGIDHVWIYAVSRERRER